MKKVADTIQRGGKYYFKRRVPPEIRHHYGGKEIHQISLKTSDPADAERQVRKLRVTMDEQLEQAKASAGLAVLTEKLSPDQKALLERAGGLPGLLAEFQASQAAGPFLVAGAPDRDDFDILDEYRVEEAAHRGAVAELKVQSNTRGKTLRLLGQDVQLDGDVYSLTDLVEDWAPSVRTATANKTRKVVRHFTDYHGEIDLKDLTGAHLREYIDAAAGLPKNPSHAHRTMPFRDIIADVKKSKATTIGFETRHQQFGDLKKLMAHAHGRRFIDVDSWSGMKLPKPTTGKFVEEERRRPFTGEEVQRILDYVTKSNDPKFGRTTIDFWGPWLGAYHGLRIQEACQVRTCDFFEVNGVWSLKITDEGPLQRLKTAHSLRTVPVHPKLVEMGLRAVVEARPADANVFLQFDHRTKKLRDLRPNSEGLLSGAYSNRFNGSLLRSKVGIADPHAVFHSFRHRFKDVAENVGIPEAHRRYLTGRANADAVEGRYGKGPGTDFLLDSLSKIDPT